MTRPRFMAAETVTDEQLRELALSSDPDVRRAANRALHSSATRERIRARARCAKILATKEH